VTSNPTGISCGTTCTATFPSSAPVTVTAGPASGSIFSGWSGGCSGTGSCTLSGNGSVSITATFTATADTQPTYTLAATKKGPGSITSNPQGINCGSVCWAAYANGTVVTLTAVPVKGARFLGWSGAGCSGTGICTVTLNAKVSVTARFTQR